MACRSLPLHPATDPVAEARRLADDVLFPAATGIEAKRDVPLSQLDALADAGLYGLFGPRGAGGLAAGPEEGHAVTEALAGGCLTTAFVWTQHHHSVRAVSTTAPGPLRDEWLGPLCRGERRAGVAFAGLRRPGPPVLTATAAPGGWRLDGYAPWVTGWGRVDVVHVGASQGDRIVWALVDAATSRSLTVERLELAAVNASATVTVTFAGHFVPDARVTAIEPMADWRARDALGLRANGSQPLGLALRCARLVEALGADAGPINVDVGVVRGQLDAADRPPDSGSAASGSAATGSAATGSAAMGSAAMGSAATGSAAMGPTAMVEARARASLLAVRAAASLVAATGGRAVTTDQHGQRLLREAMFLLVFGQTPAIKAAQLDELRRCPGST